eukprot:TRINITY_DN4159_c0_g1_i1.p1 TRINITY_DN4159_c0_g1~~TRINITY_DN4159_c0_g1_i1.p1  ORF type:complete len:133 (+),score=5.25 TRINITY_DN4159_c0_g1_i1:59-400(+)
MAPRFGRIPREATRTCLVSFSTPTKKKVVSQIYSFLMIESKLIMAPSAHITLIPHLAQVKRDKHSIRTPPALHPHSTRTPPALHPHSTRTPLVLYVHSHSLTVSSLIMNLIGL